MNQKKAMENDLNNLESMLNLAIVLVSKDTRCFDYIRSSEPELINSMNNYASRLSIIIENIEDSVEEPLDTF